MLTFSDKYIQRIINDFGVYARGIKLTDNVKNFKYIKDENLINATVRGTYDYEVEIELNEKGSVRSYRCDCDSFRSYFGACKHIVAVMKYANDYEVSSPYNTQMTNSQTNSNDIYLPISELGLDFRRKRQKINLWVEQNIVLKTSFNPAYLQIELKIGLEKPYKIKNFQEFFNAVNRRIPIYFGKSFTFDPNTMFFSGVNKDIMEFLLKLNEKEEFEKDFHNPYDYGNDRKLGSIRSNRVVLIEDNMKRYFDIVKDSNMPFKISEYPDTDCEIVEDMEIRMEIKQVDDLLVLEADYNKDEEIVPLTRDYQLVLNPNTFRIYRIPEEKAKLLGKIHSIRQRQMKPLFRVQKNEQEKFIREFFKPYKDKVKVLIDAGLEEKMAQKELVTKVYFDVINNGISAKIEYCYGEMVVNPFDKQGQSNYDYYMRNYEQEEMVENFLKSSGMYEYNGLMVLEDEENIAQLLSGRIKELNDLAEVYYSEEFKKIQIRSIKKMHMGVRLNNESNLLEFDFKIDDFNDGELHRLFYSIKEKRKYYRLKNGTILKLDSDELINVSKLINDLSLDTRKFKDGVLDLPANRALFVDNFINERNMNDFHKSDRFKELVDDIAQPKELDLKLDDDLDTVLRGYQKFGFKWLKTLSRYGFGGILADDMGLGKTLQVLAFIKDERKADKKPCLVVAPTSLIYNWKAEVEKFVPDLKVEVVHGSKVERNLLLRYVEDKDIIVTSYGSLKRDIEHYREMNFSYIFVDEAQHIKNPNTLNANSVKSLNAKGYFAMTGTPIENSLTELWSIFDFVMPGYLMSHNSFVTKFEKPIVQNNDKEALNTLSRFIKPFVLRRLKGEVLKELPEKIESKVVTDMSQEQKKLYAAYLKQAQSEVAAEIREKGIERSKIKILALLTRLRQICCHPAMFVENYKGGSGKLDTLLEIIGDSIDSGHRLLLFSQFTSMHDIIGKALKELGKNYFYIDGATKAKDRMDMVNRFNDGENDLFLISLKAGGTGLNLTGADMVIHYDPWWNPAVEDQATDRAYRIGQTKAVQVFKIITKGTIEEKIYELQEKKRGLINNVIRPGENLLTKLKEEEIRELFQI
ncbi:MAG: ATP-dependent helicase HepA [Firmicutes bacterium ADurb.Bin419]|nr:MAG: ATP-dependent helicase HepA [Firmicutes bacterium ADurb.Bin419]